MPQERVHRRLRAKPRDAEAREHERIALAASALLAEHDPASRPTEEARQPDATRQVEPDHGVRPLEDEVAELAAVGAVDHPPVARHDRLHAAPELVGVELGPPGLVVDRVELDVGGVER